VGHCFGDRHPDVVQLVQGEIQPGGEHRRRAAGEADVLRKTGKLHDDVVAGVSHLHRPPTQRLARAWPSESCTEMRFNTPDMAKALSTGVCKPTTASLPPRAETSFKRPRIAPMPELSTKVTPCMSRTRFLRRGRSSKAPVTAARNSDALCTSNSPSSVTMSVSPRTFIDAPKAGSSFLAHKETSRASGRSSHTFKPRDGIPLSRSAGRFRLL